MSMTPTKSIEPVTKEVKCESDQTPSGLSEAYDVVTFHEDSMAKMSRAIVEYDELDNESSLFETLDITIPLSVEEFKSKYHLWTTPLPPSFGDSFKTSYPHKLNRSPFARIFRKPHFAKLEGVQDQNTWDVLYDTYYGWKVLFEDLWRSRVKLDVKRSAFWEATQGKYS